MLLLLLLIQFLTFKFHIPVSEFMHAWMNPHSLLMREKPCPDPGLLSPLVCESHGLSTEQYMIHQIASEQQQQWPLSQWILHWSLGTMVFRCLQTLHSSWGQGHVLSCVRCAPFKSNAPMLFCFTLCGCAHVTVMLSWYKYSLTGYKLMSVYNYFKIPVSLLVGTFAWNRTFKYDRYACGRLT